MKERVFDLLKKYTKHEHIELTSRGNTAIFAALYCARKINPKKIILTVDQGGWLSYLKYPKRLEFKVELVKTDYGIVDLKDINKKLADKNCCAFLYANPAGYFAGQPIKDIYEICKKNDCLVILDVTGSIGSELCNGKFADFTVGSFGKWKPINLGYGGFLSARQKRHFSKLKEIDDITFNEKYLPSLYKKLKSVKEKYKLFNKLNKKIKKDLKEFKILHNEKRGINVIIKFDTEKEKNKIIDYCIKNKHQFTICPRYIRVNEKAISIEVKRKE